MRLCKSRNRHLPEMNITPMIDVTFLLLIFFVTVTQVSQVNREQLQLPKQAGEKDQERSTLTININRPGQMTVAGAVVDRADLAAMVAAELEKAGGDPRQVKILVRMDQGAETRAINQLVDQFEQFDVKVVELAVETPN
ncbi:ExbD/TolR family protein [Blastopirellula retiformator]|uniref:Biopolymer transport protein ExbD n=1 Tax=Blastopirellula retiformator TaxID=2527970 RepID=A0A5C5VPV7_9BACT|nr:biopolymer transporter ExbD [Blastopirellula retiformator]TWT39652.1 biopolymer transport protein ExbD [Blastopirellula retiformator]